MTMVMEGACHAKVAAAKSRLDGIERELCEASQAIAELSARKNELTEALREARIQQSMGRSPARAIGDLKADLASIDEDLETADARLVGLQRLKAGEAEMLASAWEALRVAHEDWFRRRAGTIRDRMERAAQELAAAQRTGIAVLRSMQRLGIDEAVQREVMPLHFVYLELVVSHGGDSKCWPRLGDRRTGDLADELREIGERLQEL